MEIVISSFWAQKDGNAPEEYEDAFDYKITPRGCVVAMSDGATEASFSQKWAQILTHGFVGQSPRCWSRSARKRGQRFLRWLRPLQKEWRTGIDFNALPWYSVEKASQGAAASLLGLEINFEKGYWQAAAVGDTNLFLMRDSKIILSWPLRKYEEFGSSPYIVWSNPQKNEMTAKALKTTGGKAQSGDVFLLMTDALAAMYLKSQFWVGDKAAFKWLVQKSRNDKELKNDDTTLVVVKIKEVD